MSLPFIPLQPRAAEGLGSKRAMLAAALFLWGISFFSIIGGEVDNIFKKDLYAHDESVNSVVSANIARTFFPPMVRTNPLTDETGDWMEGPYWQHIPPAFAYVPWLFFKFDGGVTIEMKRLSYACVAFAAGAFFIAAVYLFDASVLALMAATLAGILWLLTPFSRRLLTGLSFGASDIVLTFTVVLSFAALCLYLGRDREERIYCSYSRIALISAAVSLPVIVKSMLGLIPCSTFFVLLVFDHKKISRKVLAAAAVFFGIISIYYGALYMSSPQTFVEEIKVPFEHFGNYEGWAAPWHFFITRFIPRDYLGGYRYSVLYYAAILAGFYGLYRFKDVYTMRTKQVLLLSAAWFMCNLIAISVVTSKSPNFIYQSYLLSIFFACYSVFLLAKQTRAGAILADRLRTAGIKYGFYAGRGLWVASAALGLLFIYSGASFFDQFHQKRAVPYVARSQNEKFFLFSEIMRKEGANPKNIFIINATNEDYWFRYYILFLTGAEARSHDEDCILRDFGRIKEKYTKVYFVFEDGWKRPFHVNIACAVRNVGGFTVMELEPQHLDKRLLQELVKNIKEV